MRSSQKDSNQTKTPENLSSPNDVRITLKVCASVPLISGGAKEGEGALGGGGVLPLLKYFPQPMQTPPGHTSNQDMQMTLLCLSLRIYAFV